MIDIKKSKAPTNTVTLDKLKIEEPTGNIFEAIAIMARRTEQISLDIRKELLEKLDEFAMHNESLEEIFENREQIEVSRYYESLPKAHAVAVEEWLKGNIYYRYTDEEDKE